MRPFNPLFNSSNLSIIELIDRYFELEFVLFFCIIKLYCLTEVSQLHKMGDKI